MNSPLITADWLKDHLQDEQLRIVDCRFSLADPQAGRQAYGAGHLLGAVYLDLERDLSGPKREGGAGGRHPLPKPDELATRLGALGIGDESLVVAYDDPPGGGMFAARLWWLLRWLGHEGVAVLDGGVGAWRQAGGALVAEVPHSPPATFTPRPRPELVTDAAGVAQRGEAALVDSRAAARYSGAVEPLDRAAGHIPGALNLDWAGALDEEGRFKSAQEQRGRFAAVEGQDAVFYCGSGVSAAVNLLALEVAGRPLGPNTRLYAGSWSDWVSDGGRPVATGTEPFPNT